MNEFLKNNEHHFHFVFRVVIGLLFVIHGLGKWGMITSMNFGSLFFYAGIIEIVGGAFIILGLFTRITALVCALEIGYAFLIVHVLGKGFNLNPVGATGNGGEAALLFFVSFLVIAATGPTSWSVHKE